jgi:diguanylate cyclase (GGDEF)-like protein
MVGILYVDKLLGDRAIFVKNAIEASEIWADKMASQLDPEAFGLDKTARLGANRANGTFNTLFARPKDLGEVSEFGDFEMLRTYERDPAFPFVRENRLYFADGKAAIPGTKNADAQQLQYIQRAWNQGVTQGRYLHDEGRFARHKVETYTPIGVGKRTLGVLRVDIDKSIVSAGVVKIFHDMLFFAGIGMTICMVIGGAFLSRSITRSDRSQKELMFMANHDGLTGTWNRHKFNTELSHAIDYRESGIVLLAGLVNIDRFKEINDTLGHIAGDHVLQSVGQRCQKIFGKDCAIARISADEFAILQRGSKHDFSGFEIKMGDLLAKLSDPIFAEGHTIRLTVSAGMAQAPRDALDAKELMKAADLAMREAKKVPGSHCRDFNFEMADRLERRRRMEREMKSALSRGFFQLHYQPQFDLGDDTLTGYEALIRWKHPLEGMISPGEFIPLAEETGFIKELGAWVVEQACRDATTLPDHLTIAVNISAVQFELDEVSQMVAGALERTGLAPHRLEIEVTESVLVDNREYVAQQLTEIAELGCGVAIDDFGTGYSSLTYLADFPFTKIKIDRSFVIRMEESHQTGAIVSTIIALSQSLGAKTIAEGVETEDQAVLLRAAGCHSVQGFLYGRPAPLSDQSNDNPARAPLKVVSA